MPYYITQIVSFKSTCEVARLPPVLTVTVNDGNIQANYALAGEHIHAHSLIKARTLSICFLNFPWRMVSEKSTFKDKSFIFLNNTNTHRNTRTHPRTSTHRKCKYWRRRKRSLLCQEVAHCATADSHNQCSRDCGFRPTTRQSDGHKI